MAQSELPLKELAGPITLHLQSYGVFAGNVDVIADPDTTYPQFVFGVSPDELAKTTIHIAGEHVYLTLAEPPLNTHLISASNRSFSSAGNSIFAPTDTAGSMGLELNNEQKGDTGGLSLKVNLPAGSSVIANLRKPKIMLEGDFDEICVSSQSGFIGVFGVFNDATVHSFRGLIYVDDVLPGSSLTATTGSGRINVGSYRGSGRLGTVSGAVWIADADPEPVCNNQNTATLQIETMTGNVEYTPASPEAAARIKAESRYGTVNGVPATPPRTETHSQPAPRSDRSAFHHVVPKDRRGVRPRPAR